MFCRYGCAVSSFFIGMDSYASYSCSFFYLAQTVHRPSVSRGHFFLNGVLWIYFAREKVLIGNRSLDSVAPVTELHRQVPRRLDVITGFLATVKRLPHLGFKTTATAVIFQQWWFKYSKVSMTSLLKGRWREVCVCVCLFSLWLCRLVLKGTVHSKIKYSELISSCFKYVWMCFFC